MTDYSKVKVGDGVWWSDVNGRGRGLSEGVVTKTGPKLITVLQSGYIRPIVFRRTDGKTNDAWGHQTLILDIEAHQAGVARGRAWTSFYSAVRSNLNDGVTLEDIQAAAALLKIQI